ncbi:hypothetical protein [Aestuariibaculum lutulentum]|uniref:Uncharacterized protein n=1 Tax=Aestuariibaculum lutulentum TaxID=2920935 RepID=A0ABS9RKD3_9FLAO|nr:hypothetical protein [Aestuariibaculum lutulentum]MCH4553404.1 hypothetical protein [Aestuariibaculum lutulentum]
MNIEKLKDTGERVFTIILIFGIILMVINSINDHESLQQHKKYGIGKVIKKGGRHNDIIYFSFFYNGKKYQTSSKHDFFNLNDEVKINGFYKVEFDITNPENSNIYITKKPLNPFKLLAQGIEIDASIDKFSHSFKNSADLNISYTYGNENFTFRCRYLLDSLPCGSFENCKNADSIKIIICKLFPELNNLYLESHDRQRLRNLYKSFL